MYMTKKPKAPANARSWLSIEQIRAGRMLADLSQEQAAEACDVSYSSWRGMERKRGRQRIQPKQMAKIVAGLRQYGVEFSREGVSYAEGYGPGDRSHQARTATGPSGSCPEHAQMPAQ